MRSRAAILVAVVVAGRTAGPPGAAAQARPAINLDLRGNPPEALVSVRQLLEERRFLAALESGFPLYMEYRVTLKQPRPLWDRSVAQLPWEYVVLYDPVRQRFTIETPEGTETVPDRDALRTRLAQVYVVGLVDPRERGEFYYDVQVTARTLSDQDVDEAFAWLNGESGDSTRRRGPGLLDRMARRVLVEVAPLPRLKLSAHSERFAIR